MNNPNPFVPKGSLLEQQSRRRSRLKIAVTCFLAIGVLSLVGLLIQGCKREKPAEDNSLNSDMDTNLNPPMIEDTNPPMVDTNPPAYYTPPPVTNTSTYYTPPQPQPQPAPEQGGSEYVVVAGDTLGHIAKSHGVSLKELESANPGVDPRKLQVKQKLVIPAGKIVSDTSSSSVSTMDSGTQTYKVKSGDTLTKIAKNHGTTIKAIEAANNLTTTKIRVDQVLKIPSKGEAVVPAATPAPTMEMAPAPPVPSIPSTSSAAPGPIK